MTAPLEFELMSRPYVKQLSVALCGNYPIRQSTLSQSIGQSETKIRKTLIQMQDLGFVQLDKSQTPRRVMVIPTEKLHKLVGTGNQTQRQLEKLAGGRRKLGPAQPALDDHERLVAQTLDELEQPDMEYPTKELGTNHTNEFRITLARNQIATQLVRRLNVLIEPGMSETEIIMAHQYVETIMRLLEE